MRIFKIQWHVKRTLGYASEDLSSVSGSTTNLLCVFVGSYFLSGLNIPIYKERVRFDDLRSLSAQCSMASICDSTNLCIYTES